jgi:hypothetical protein
MILKTNNSNRFLTGSIPVFSALFIHGFMLTLHTAFCETHLLYKTAMVAHKIYSCFLNQSQSNYQLGFLV